MLTLSETQDHQAFGAFVAKECHRLHITLAVLRADCHMKQNRIQDIKKGTI